MRDPPLHAGGRESVVAPGEGGAVDSAGGGLTAEGESPEPSARGGEGGQAANEAGGAGGQGEPGGHAGANDTGGAAGQDAGGMVSGGAAGAGGSATPGGEGEGEVRALIGDPAKGHKILVLDNCYRCHGDNLAGRGFYPNITPDMETGIGGWTDQQISTAVRGAIGPDGELFCAVMPLYSGFKPQEVADLIAFLRIVPAVKNAIVAVCPGHNP